MNGVADSTSLNKQNKNKFRYIHAYFLFFLYFFWAGLNPTSPAKSLAQASDPAGPHEACVNQITRA